MKHKKYVWTFFFLILIFAGVGIVQEKGPKEKKKENPPLVRLDLLKGAEKKLNPPVRNIFSPQKSFLEPTQPPDEKEMINLPAQKGHSPRTPSHSFAEIRYIGCVVSGPKIVGLVIFEGKAFPVEKGDFLTPDFQVQEITSQKIVIQGPDSQKRSYPLEGEEK